MPGGTSTAGTSRVPSSCLESLCVNLCVCVSLCTDKSLCVSTNESVCINERERGSVCACVCVCADVSACQYYFLYVLRCESVEGECLSSVTLHFRLTRALPRSVKS